MIFLAPPTTTNFNPTTTTVAKATTTTEMEPTVAIETGSGCAGTTSWTVARATAAGAYSAAGEW